VTGNSLLKGTCFKYRWGTAFSFRL